MAKSLLLEIVTPDKVVISEQVEYVSAPGYEGEFGILPEHILFLSALRIGSLHYQSDGKTHYVFVSGGFAEVSHNKVTILAEAAEVATDIDLARARTAQERAEKRLQAQRDSVDIIRAEAALQRALIRLQVRKSL